MVLVFIVLYVADIVLGRRLGLGLCLLGRLLSVFESVCHFVFFVQLLSGKRARGNPVGVVIVGIGLALLAFCDVGGVGHCLLFLRLFGLSNLEAEQFLLFEVFRLFLLSFAVEFELLFSLQLPRHNRKRHWAYILFPLLELVQVVRW